MYTEPEPEPELELTHELNHENSHIRLIIGTRRALCRADGENREGERKTNVEIIAMFQIVTRENIFNGTIIIAQCKHRELIEFSMTTKKMSGT